MPRNFRCNYLFAVGLFLCCTFTSFAQSEMEKGWTELARDNDREAIRHFEKAYEEAVVGNDTKQKAEALLNLGISSYGSSFSNGIDFCNQAMAVYRELETQHPEEAAIGRAKCLQLMSTIHSRQGDDETAFQLSQQALQSLNGRKLKTGYPGLIFTSLGSYYERQGKPDSAGYYYELALRDYKDQGNQLYLPGALINVAKGLKDAHKQIVLIEDAISLADSSDNVQAQVTALLARARWHHSMQHTAETANDMAEAIQRARGLSDLQFLLNALQQQLAFAKAMDHSEQAIALLEEIDSIKSERAAYEKQQIVGNLEVQFQVAEKNRQLRLLTQEKKIADLTNWLLLIGIAAVLIISVSLIAFLRKINRQGKHLLQTKEALLLAVEAQKDWQEKQHQEDISLKEKQLSSLTLQMKQKYELIQELKEGLEKASSDKAVQEIQGILNKGSLQDKEWSDFNRSFEQVNINFYKRLKEAYPEISPNDLRICALIKLNMSIKEMAAILNISPDSVKTARYRLRKRLQLNTEDSLTDFISRLS